MLAVYVRLLHGHVRAASADDLAMTGEGDPGEWPPSPARVVAALVAADGTRERCRVTSGEELALFEEARPPRIYASPRHEVLESKLAARFVVVNEREKRATVQEYPARQAQAIALGTRLSPTDPRIAYLWDDVEPTDDQLTALRRRAARVGYLGCADSPAVVGIDRTFDPDRAPVTLWQRDARGTHSLPVPTPGFVALLDTAFDAWRAGQPVRKSWYPPERALYRAPGDPVPEPGLTWPTVIWVRFDTPLPGGAALRVAETLKAAVLAKYEEHVGDVPSVMHGHVEPGGARYQLVQWLMLPEVGHRYAQGRLHGAAIMLPPLDGELVERIRHAVWHLRELFVPGLPPVAVQLHGGEPRPWAAHPDRWRGRNARRWASVFPVVHERRVRGEPTLSDVAQWCEHAGFPRPLHAHCSQIPLVSGSPALKPHEVFRDRPGARRPYSYLRLEFERPIVGPVVLGRARQFGMGLLAPLDDGARDVGL